MTSARGWADISGRADLAEVPPTAVDELRGLRAVGCGALRSLEALRYAQLLEVLDCSYTCVSDVEPLRSLRKLRKLILRGCPLESIEALEACVALSTLDVSETGVRSGIREWPGSLVALAWDGVQDVDPTAHQLLPPSLLVLSLADIGLRDLEPISRLPLLRKLSIANNEVSDLNCLRGHPHLESLILFGNLKLDCSAAEHLPALRFLVVDEEQAQHPSVLRLRGRGHVDVRVESG